MTKWRATGCMMMMEVQWPRYSPPGPSHSPTMVAPFLGPRIVSQSRCVMATIGSMLAVTFNSMSSVRDLSTFGLFSNTHTHTRVT